MDEQHSEDTSQTTTHRPLFYKIRDLQSLLGCGRSTAYEVTKQDSFPLAIQLVENGELRWVAREVQAWLTSRPRVQRTATRKPVAVPMAQEALPIQAVAATRRRRAA